MRAIGAWLVLVPLLAAPASLAAQEPSDLVARMEARGLPHTLATSVAAIATDASARGVPSGPLADKAIEGWAKRVPQARIVSAVRTFAGRMASAVDAVRGGGLEAPPGRLVAAAAEAMGGGLKADEIRSIVRAAPTPSVAAPGLSVVAALSAQGLGSHEAVALVVDAMHKHHAMSDLLNLPSVAQALHDQGVSPGDIGRRILGGDDADSHHDGVRSDRPAGVPPRTWHDHETTQSPSPDP